MLNGRQELDDLLGEIGDALQGDAAGAAGVTGGEGVDQQPRPGLFGDAAGGGDPALGERRAAQQDGAGLAGLGRFGRPGDCRVRDPGRRRNRQRRGRALRLAPGGVGRQDQGGDLAGRAPSPAATAWAPAAAVWPALSTERTQADTGRAIPATSEASGASKRW